MANTATIQCPNCKGVLRFDAQTGQLVCDYCESTFDANEQFASVPTENAPIEQGETDHAKTVDDFLERAPWEIDHQEENVAIYACCACGAHIAADQSTISTSCPYCGNNMLVSGIATSQNMPGKVLPFTLTRSDAEARMRKHFEKKWYLSRKFDASLEHLQAVYVPYHLYDISIEGRADYVGCHESGSGKTKTKSFYGLKRAGHASFERIPIDASSKMPDGHMDAIAPFDFDKMQDFSTSYMASYLAEVPDESVDECLPRAIERAKRSFDSDLKEDATRNNERSVSYIAETVHEHADATVDHSCTCMLPVWLMHCTWGELDMLFAVNGDTGECVGDLPIDKRRRFLTMLAIAAVGLLFATLLAFALVEGEASTKVIGDSGAFVIIMTGLALFSIDKHFRNQMITANETTDASMSYNDRGLVVTERWQSKRCFNHRKARERLEEYNAEG